MDVQVEGMSAPVDETLAAGAKDLWYDERRLRSDTGYCSSVACSKEVSGCCMLRCVHALAVPRLIMIGRGGVHIGTAEYRKLLQCSIEWRYRG